MYDDFYSDSDSDGFEFTAASDPVFTASSFQQGSLSTVKTSDNQSDTNDSQKHASRQLPGFGVPPEVKQNLQRQNLSTHMASMSGQVRPVGRGRARFLQAGADCDQNTGQDSQSLESTGTWDRPSYKEWNSSSISSQQSGSSGFEEVVDWEAEPSAEQYVVKPKTLKTFMPKSANKPTTARASGSATQLDRSKYTPNPSSNWIESTLANGPPQQSEKEMRQISADLDRLWAHGSIKDKTQLTQYLNKQYTSSVNPYILVAFLIHKSQDAHVGKTTTLSFTIIKEFEKWCKTRHKEADLQRYVTSDLQLQMFDLCTRTHMTMFDSAVKCYGLCYPGNDQFVPFVRKFLEKKKYKEVAVCAGKLGLQHHFSIDQVILPLILQDKVNLIETYVCGYPEHQQTLVQYLDHLCDRDTDLDLIISSIPNVPGMKREKFQKKTLSKLAVRLSKLYKVPHDLCPNINNARGVGAIRYLLHKKYIEKGMGSGSWEEMVRNAVDDNKYLQEQLVEQLVLFNEMKEAVKWTNEYNLSDDVIPESLREMRYVVENETTTNQATDSNTVAGEDWESECFTTEEMQIAYYQLSVPLENVHIIDTRDGFYNCLTSITKPNCVVGIDSEWKPGFAGGTQKVALLQLALRDQIFLLDMVALEQQLDDKSWEHFVDRFFCNDQVLKLGYGIESDLKMLLKSFPNLHGAFVHAKRIVNLEVIAKKLVLADMTIVMFDENEDNDKVIQPNDDDDDDDSSMSTGFSKSEEKGLSELVRRCFGKPLNKSEQMSNWERRPLRTEQLIYAALDAHVLLELYECLTKLALKQDTSIDLEPKISMKWLKPSKNEKKRARRRGDGKMKSPHKLPAKQTPVAGAPRTPGELHVVVDTMLTGLGRQLRTCGVDVHIAEPFGGHDQTIDISLRENRIVLTSGMPYDMIVSSVGPSMCYNVMKEKARDQVVEVLQHFNVKVRQKDIFSRCQICNGNIYLTVPSEDMHHLYLQKLKISHADQQTNTETLPNDSKNTSQSSRFEEYGIDWNTATVISSGVPVCVNIVPEAMFSKVNTFYCCATCGKVFWEGSHFERVCDQFSHVLDMQEKGLSVYEEISKKQEHQTVVQGAESPDENWD